MLSPGDHARVNDGGVLAAVDERSYDEAVRAAEINDEIGKARLIASGRVFSLAEGPEVLIVDESWSGERKQVRILSASPESHFGQVVWIPKAGLAKIKRP